MTLYSTRALAFTKPEHKATEDPMFKVENQKFTYDAPEWLKGDSSFQHCVKAGTITIMDSPKKMDKVTKNPKGPREGLQHEVPADSLGIIDGGNAAKQ